MVGIFSAGSHGLGGSIDQLGIKGLLGNPAAGRGKENFYLNAASGNLVVRRGDEYLAAKGDDLGVIRTYNSQGGFDGDNNDGWRMSAYRWVESLTGTANTAGSTITRVDGDGRRSLYTYDAVKGVYSGVDGSGANDTLGFDASGGVWTWNDGATERFETYQWDAAAGRGRLTRLYDGDGNEQTYQYGETGLLSKVRLSSGESVVFTYAGANLESVSVLGSDEVQRTRTGYQYDALGRLSQVRIKLGDDNDYTIAYTYDGDSKRLASVQEKDGTHLAFSYVEAGGQYRLATITDVALNRITSFSYDMASNTTLVTDALGGQTVLRYDSQGRLLETSIQNGGVANVVKYTYDTDGRVTSATDAAGRKVSYGYDAAGNRIWQQNETGDRIESIYDGQNRLLSEKRIAPNDPNSGRTTRHAYDGQGHRRFTVSGAGRVVEYRYDGQGQLIAEMRYAGAAYAGSADLAALESWAAEQDKMQAELTEYAYDFRGQLSSVKRYAATLADGTGDAGGTVQVSHYVYDQHGRLLSRLDGNGAGTIYTYDDLDRVLTSSSAGHVTSYSYDDALNRTAITTADNVQSVRQYSAAGELLSVTQAGAVTAYEYDKKGRLRRETDPTGVRKYYLYDSVDRLIAVINGNDGKMVEYGYSKRGYLAKTVEYANALSATQLTQLTTAGTSGVAPLFGNIADLTPYRPVKNAVQDREQWDLYDDQGRLAKRIDAVNGLTEYQYGGAGEVLATIRYATAFTGWARNSLTVDTPPESVVGTASSADPIERRIYDADGKLLAAIDAENGLTEYRYDGAGRLTQMTGYANRIAATASLRPKLEDIRPAASPEDQHTYHWYDDRGLLIATVDAERYLTTYQYDGNGRRTAVVRHAGKLTVAVPGSTVEAMRANAQVPGKDQAASYEYDGRGLLVKETAANGLVTAYEYSGDGRLLKRIQGAGTAQSRTVLRTYDSKGRLWKETDGVGRATTYEYDQADRLASKTDGNGNKTVYYYDAQNRLAYEINALGEVRQTVYDQFSQVVQRISYGNRIDTAVTLPSLAGGLVNETLRQAVNGIANSAKDSKLRWEYNQVGRLALTADANNYTTYSAQYDVLGNLRQSYHHWGGRTLRTDYLYDKLGRATQQQKRDNNNNVVTAQEQYAYDAFGRLIKQTDPRGGITVTEYDRLGRVITVSDPLNQKRRSTYDAFNRVLTHTDALDRTTTYSYSADHSSVTVTSPEGISVTTESNLYGQTVKVTDGNGKSTTYAYDQEGRLTQATDAANNTVTHAYAANKMTVTDASGVVTEHVYDAAGRTSKVTVDPGGLKLVTTYDYDGKGQQIRVTDPAGFVTETQFNLNGHVTAVSYGTNNSVDRTTYYRDTQGNITQVTEGGDYLTRTTQYQYDHLLRRVAEIVDPNGLQLKTTYTYDAAGNMVARTDPEGRIWRYGYDANNRLVLSVAPDGVATSYVYDANGRQIKKTVHATPLSGLPAPADMAASSNWAANIVPAVTAEDRSDHTVYDRDGRIRYTIDAARRVTGYEYDGNGKVVKTTRYARTDWSRDAGNKLTIAASGEDRLTGAVYDAVGRALYTVDELGRVTGYAYDKAGRQARRIEYGTTIAWPKTTPLTAGDLEGLSAAGAVRSGQVYDGAGRVRAAVDASGRVTSYTYGPGGQVATTTEHAVAADWTGDATIESQAAAIVAEPHALNRTETAIYDKAGRVAYRINAQREVTLYQYDGGGLLIGSTQFAKRYTGTAMDKASLDAYYAQYSPNRSAQDRTEYLVRDRAGRLAYKVDALRQVTRYQYNKLGELVGSVQYATKYSEWGGIDKSYLDSYYSSSSNLSAQDRQTAVVQDLAKHLRYEIDAAGRVRVVHYNNFGQADRVTELGTVLANWSTRKLGTNPVTLSELETLASQGGGRIVSRSVYDNAGQLLYEQDAQGRVTGYSYDAFGAVTVTTQYVNSGSFAAASDGSNGAYTAPAAANGDRREAVVQALGERKTYRIDAAGRVTVEERNAFGQVVKVVQAGTVVAGWSTRGEAADALAADQLKNLAESGANAADNRIVSRTVYDAGGRAVYEVGAQGQVSKTLYDAFGAVRARISYAALYSGALTQEALDAYYKIPAEGEGPNPNLSAEDRQTAVVQDLAKHLRYEIDAAGRVRVVHYNNFGQADRVTELGTVLPNWSTRNLGANPVTLSELETLASQGGNRVVSRMVYDNAGQLRYEQDAQGRVTGYGYDAFGAVTVMTQYVNSGSFAGTSDGSNGAYTTPAAANGDRREAVVQVLGERKTYRIDAAGRVTVEERNAFGETVKVVQAGTVVPGWSTRGDAADALAADKLKSLVESGANAADNRIVSRTVYDAGGRAVYEVGAQGQASKTLYDAFGAIKARISYAVPYNGALTQEALDAYYGATTNLSADDRQTAVVEDLAKHLRYEIDAAGRVRVVHYNNFGQADRVTELGAVLPNWSTRNLGANPVTLSELETLASQGGNRVVSRSVYDVAGQLLYEQDAQGRVTGYGYDAFGAVTVTTQYVNSGSFAGTSDGGNGAYTAPAATDGDRREVVVESLGERKTYRIDAAGRVTVEERNAFGQVVKVVQAGTVVAGWSTRGEAADALAADKLKSLVESGANAADNRIVSRTVYDAGGRAVYEVGAQGQASKTLYDAFGAVKARISYAVPYNGALTQEALDAYYSTTTNLSADDRQTAVVEDLAKHLRYEIDAAGRVRVVHYNNFGQADRVTELGAALPNWSTRKLGTNPVTPSELEALASQGGNRVVNRSVYDTAGQLRYEQDAQGRVTGYSYDAFGAVTVMTQYVNSGSFAGTSDGGNGAYTAPVATNEDRREAVVESLGERKTYRIDAAGRVTVEERNAFGETVKVVQAGTVVSDWSTRGEAADALAADQLKSLVESGANAADNRATAIVQDLANRRVFRIDAGGHVTLEEFNVFGQTIVQTRLAAKVSDWGAAASLPSADTLDGMLDAAWDTHTYLQYDAAGRLFRQMDGAGNVTETTYNRFGEAVRVRHYVRMGAWNGSAIGVTADAADRISGMVYDQSGRRTYEIDWRGGVTRHVYNAFGEDVTTIAYATAIDWPSDDAALQTALATLAAGNHAQDRYSGVLRNAAGQVVYSIDAGGYVVHTVYNAFGEAVAQTALTQRLAPLSASRQVLSMQDVAGIVARTSDRRTASARDASGNVILDIDADGNIREYVYNQFGEQVLVIEHAMPTTPRTAANQVLSAADVQALSARNKPHDPRNRYLGRVYDANGALSYAIDAKGAVTRLLRNHAGEEIGQVRYAQQLPSWPLAESALTEAQLQQKIVPDAANDRYEAQLRNALGQVVATIDAGGRVVEYGYNPTGQVTSIVRRATLLAPRTQANPALSGQDVEDLATSPNDRYEAKVYDDIGRLTASVDALGGLTTYRYNAHGEVTAVVRYANKVMPGNAAWPAQPLSDDEVTAAITVVELMQASDADRRSYTIYQGLVRYDIDAERYVTATLTDIIGRTTTVTRYPTPLGSSIDPAVLTALDAATIAALSAADSQGVGTIQTITQYDAKGRVISVKDALNRITQTSYDDDPAIGQSVTVYMPQGDGYATVTRVISGSERITHADGSVTMRQYDADGLLIQQIDAYGTNEQVTVQYAYDAFGGMIAAVDARGAALVATDTEWAAGERQALGYPAAVNQLTDSQRRALLAKYTQTTEYDLNGRVIRSSDGTGATVRMTYDTFGNVVEETNALGGKTHRYYDKLDRETLAIDAARRYTKTEYQDSAAKRTVTHGSVGEGVNYGIGAPPASLAAATHTVAAILDKLERVTETLDTTPGEAERKTTEEYNVFGERTARTVHAADFGAASATYEYTKLGQLKQETVPGNTSDGKPILNKYQYDARGNLTLKRQAADSADERATAYVYDAAGQLKREGTVNAVGIYTESGGWQNQQLATEYQYDARGRRVQVKDGAGHLTRTYYNRLGQAIATVNAAGTLTRTWTDPAGNAYQIGTYGTAVTVPPVTVFNGVAQPDAVPQGTGSLQRIVYRYDAANRRIQSTIPQVLLGEYSSTINADGGYITYVGDVTERTVYDGAGNAIRQTDARGHVVRSWYDAAGRKILQVDAAGYATAYGYTAATMTERRYGSAVTLPASVLDNSKSAQEIAAIEANAQANTAAASGHEAKQVRTTVTKYNGRGDLLETAVQTDAGLAVTTYAYNGLGLLESKTDADGVKTAYRYDALGRLIKQTVELKVIDAAGNNTGANPDASPAGEQVTEYGYNGVGETIRKIQRGAGGLADRIVEQRYNAAGRLIAQKDAAGYSWTTFGYDAAGRQTWIAKVLKDADGEYTSVVTSIAHDAAGRELTRTDFTRRQAPAWQDGAPLVDTSTWSSFPTGAGWKADTVQEQRYDAHGRLVAKGEHAYGATSYQLQEFFEYDNAGRLFKTNSGDGVTKLIVRDATGNATLTLRSSGSLDLRPLSLAQAAALSPSQLMGMTLTVSAYDRRGQLVETITPRDSVADIMAQLAERLGPVLNSNSNVALQVNASPASLPTGRVESTNLATSARDIAFSGQLVEGAAASPYLRLSYDRGNAPVEEYNLWLSSLTVSLPPITGMGTGNLRVQYQDAAGFKWIDVSHDASSATIPIDRLAGASPEWGSGYIIRVFKQIGDGWERLAESTGSFGPGSLSKWDPDSYEPEFDTETKEWWIPDLPLGPQQSGGSVLFSALHRINFLQQPTGTTALRLGYREIGSNNYLWVPATRRAEDGTAWSIDYSSLPNRTLEFIYVAEVNGNTVGKGSGYIQHPGGNLRVSVDPQLFSKTAQTNVPASGHVTGMGNPAFDLWYQIYGTQNYVDRLVIPLTPLAGMSALDTGSFNQWEIDLIDPQTNTLIYRGIANAGAGEIVLPVGAELPSRGYDLRLYRRINDFGSRIQLAADSMHIPLSGNSPVPGNLAVFEMPPRLILGGVPATTHQVKLGYRLAGSSGMHYVDLPRTALYGWSRADLYQLVLPEGGFTRNAAYEFEYFAVDANGVVQSRGSGTFTVNEVGNVRVGNQQALPVGGIGSVRFQANGVFTLVDGGRSALSEPQAAPVGTAAKLRYRQAGSSAWSEEIAMSADGLLPGAFNWNPQGLAAGTYEYVVTVADASGKTVNHVGGRIELGGQPAVLSYGRWQDYAGNVKVAGVPAGTATVELTFVRSDGTAVPVTVHASPTDPGVVFYWDPAAHGLSGANGTYTVTARDGNGGTLAAYGGTLDLAQGAQVVFGNRTGGGQAAIPPHAREWKWELNGLHVDSLAVRQRYAYSAFGEQIEQVDALGHATRMQYDTAGRLIAHIAPQTSIENADGTTYAFTPTTRYAYSKGGYVVRVTNVRNADDPENVEKNNVTRYSYLGGVRGKDGGGLVFKTFNADGTVKTMRHNVFGEMDRLTNEIGNATHYWYDNNGNLIKQIRPNSTILPDGAIQDEDSDSYTYDAAGNRTSHTYKTMMYESTETSMGWFDSDGNYSSSSKVQYSETDKTYYDNKARVIKTVSAAGKVKTYNYDYVGNITGMNGEAVGGYRLTVSEPGAPQAQITETSHFGHKTYHRDFGGNTIWYWYDHGGRLRSEHKHLAGTDPSSRVIKNYEYYTNGAVKSVADEGTGTDGGLQTRYGYDANGRVTSIALTSLDGRSHLYNETSIRYDSHGRQAEVRDRRATAKYSYDEVGNVRHIYAIYGQMEQNPKVQDYWYAYDRMGRQTVAMGGWGYDSEGQYRIVAGDFGVTVDYDAVGNRGTVIYGKYAQANKNKGVVQIETYKYDKNNNNFKVTYIFGNNSGTSLHYRRGTVSVTREEKHDNPYPGSGSTSLSVTALTRYDADENVASRTTWTTSPNGSVQTPTLSKRSSETYHYSGGLLNRVEQTQESFDAGNPVEGSKTRFNTYYGNQWGDAARQTMIYTEKINDSGAELQSKTFFTYSANGNLVASTTEDAVGEDKGKRTMRYMVNSQGQVLQSEEMFYPKAPDSSHHITRFHNQYVVTDKKTVGYLSNRGAEVSNYAAPTTDEPGLPTPLTTVVADFDQNFAPQNQRTSASMGGGATSYTVRAGDTMQSIAQAVWGDGSLWYRIAEANGMGGGQALQVGQTLSLPNNVVATGHTGTTTRPSQAAQIDALASLAAPSGQQHCGTTQLLIIAAVGIAMTVATGGLAAIAVGAAGAALGLTVSTTAAAIIGGMVGAAAGSAATQGLKIATGLQKEFSWSEVGVAAAMGGISAGIGAGAGELLKGSQVIVGQLGRAAAAGLENAAQQGIENLAGSRRGFDAIELGLSTAGALIPGTGGDGPSTFADIGRWAPAAAAKSFGMSMAGGMLRDAVAGRQVNFSRLAGNAAGQAALGVWGTGWGGIGAELDAHAARGQQRGWREVSGHTDMLDWLRLKGQQAYAEESRRGAMAERNARFNRTALMSAEYGWDGDAADAMTAGVQYGMLADRADTGRYRLLDQDLQFGLYGRWHVAKNGDSLARIGTRAGMSLGAMINANRLADPARIRVGEAVYVPGLFDTDAAADRRATNTYYKHLAMTRRQQVPQIPDSVWSGASELDGGMSKLPLFADAGESLSMAEIESGTGFFAKTRDFANDFSLWWSSSKFEPDLPGVSRGSRIFKATFVQSAIKAIGNITGMVTETANRMDDLAGVALGTIFTLATGEPVPDDWLSSDIAQAPTDYGTQLGNLGRIAPASGQFYALFDMGNSIAAGLADLALGDDEQAVQNLSDGFSVLLTAGLIQRKTGVPSPGVALRRGIRNNMVERGLISKADLATSQVRSGTYGKWVGNTSLTNSIINDVMIYKGVGNWVRNEVNAASTRLNARLNESNRLNALADATALRAMDPRLSGEHNLRLAEIAVQKLGKAADSVGLGIRNIRALSTAEKTILHDYDATATRRIPDRITEPKMAMPHSGDDAVTEKILDRITEPKMAMPHSGDDVVTEKILDRITEPKMAMPHSALPRITPAEPEPILSKSTRDGSILWRDEQGNLHIDKSMLPEFYVRKLTSPEALEWWGFKTKEMPGPEFGLGEMAPPVARDSRLSVENNLKSVETVRARARSISDEGACFVKGTLIHTKNGLVPIEEIRIGDQVLTQPEETGELAYKAVVNRFVFQDKKIFRVSFETEHGVSETVLATPNHPFWVKDIGWTGVEGLERGHVVELHDRTTAVVSAVEDTGMTDQVYNFEVDGFHTYYVGTIGIWVHNNDCGEPSHAKDIRDRLPSGARVVKEPDPGVKKPYTIIFAHGTQRYRELSKYFSLKEGTTIYSYTLPKQTISVSLATQLVLGRVITRVPRERFSIDSGPNNKIFPEVNLGPDPENNQFLKYLPKVPASARVLMVDKVIPLSSIAGLSDMGEIHLAHCLLGAPSGLLSEYEFGTGAVKDEGTPKIKTGLKYPNWIHPYEKLNYRVGPDASPDSFSKLSDVDNFIRKYEDTYYRPKIY